MRFAACCAAFLLGLSSLPVTGANPEAGAGAAVVLGERQPPALSSGLGIDILGIPTGNNAPALPAPDIDANRYGPGMLVGFGQVVYDQVDMQIQGRDEVTTLVISRRHLSRRNQEHSIFGPAWAFNYRHTITRDSNGNAIVESFGRKDFFVAVEGTIDVWEGTEGRFDRLTYSAGKYTLRMPHGTLLEFAADNSASNKPGHLTKITSPNGNTLVFAYDTDEPDLLKRRLFSITESFGRAITFTYGTDNTSPWVTKITDFSGREVVYSYNANGQLLSTRSPTVTSTGELNDFPNGKTHRYAYLNHADPKLKNALKSVIFPNQHAAGNELTRSEWNYRTNGVNDPFFGYVEKYTLGNTNAPATLGAGGTFAYAYKTSGEIKSDLNEPAWEIVVTDRIGTKTTYLVNRVGHILSEAIANRTRTNNPSAFKTSFKYNADGQLTNRFEPLGGKTDYVYANRRDLKFNQGRSIPRNSEINLTSTLRFPDQRGARQAMIREDVIYEPIFNLPFKVTNPRGFDVTEKLTSSETTNTLRQRFTTTFFYDYMEDLTAAKTHVAPLLGLTATQLQDLLSNAGITDLSTDVNGDTRRDQRMGNLIKIDYPDVPRPKTASGENLGLRVGLAGDAEQAEELFRYNQFGQVIYHRDAEENVTTTAYYGANDPDGNGTIDTSGAVTSEGGYRKSVVRDAEAGAGRNSGQNPAPVAQTTTYEYKAQGNFPANLRGVPTAVTDPRGIKSILLINELDQVIKTVQAADVSASTEAGLVAFAYQSISLYDHNDNVVETRIQNKETLDNDNDFIVRSSIFDILDQPTSQTLNPGTNSLSAIKNTVAYSPSQNPLDLVMGANNSATAPDRAKTTIEYDERDLPVIKTLAADEGDAQRAAFETNRDANGDPTQKVDGEDSDPDDAADGAVGGDPTNIKYDGFNRQIEVVDRVGNRTTYQYDSASNVRSIQSLGPVDHTATDQRLLARTDTRYDERNRAFRIDRHIFQYNGKKVGSIDAGALDPSNQKVSTVTLYDRLGRVVGTVDAENDTYKTLYDGLSRIIATIDPLTNEVHNTYDRNGNLIQVREVEKSPLIASDEIFISTNRYDALNRLTAFVEPNGQTTTYQYDSRNNQIKITDQLGNQTEKRYDRLDRLVETRIYLSSNGINASAANKDTNQCDDGVITLKQEWDDLNRLVAQIDDRTNRTEYVYDDLNRKVRTTYANGTFESWRYNDDSELQESVDQNGTRVTYSYDAKSRRTGLEVLLSPSLGGLGGTTQKTWRYDGLDRTTLATDNNGEGSDDDVTCTYFYDSLSRQIRETQKIGTLPELAIDTEWQGAGRKISATYPNGRKVNRSYDALDRLFEITEAAAPVESNLISRFEYVGPSRDIRTTYGNEAILDKRNSGGTQTISGANAGYDNNRRHLRHEWKKGAQSITAYVNTYNGANRRVSEKREHLANHIDSYSFDSKYRMTGFRRNGTGIGVGGTFSQRTLNGADKMVTLAHGDTNIVINLGTTNGYARMNQYEAFDDKLRTYDRNSSLESDGEFKYIHDFQNRIVEIRRDSDSIVVGKYTYDANSRRVLRDLGNTKTRYLYVGWQIVEERNGANAVQRQYVDGREIDEHLQIKNVPTAEVYFYHASSQGSIGALTSTNGTVVEFYEYSWLGKPTIRTNATTTLTTSQVNNPYFFQGRQVDPETTTASSAGLYYYRNRYYSADTGEFLTIDPLGYWNHGQGNGFSAFDDDGWNSADPMGEANDYKLRQHGNHLVFAATDPTNSEGTIDCLITARRLSITGRILIVSGTHGDRRGNTALEDPNLRIGARLFTQQDLAIANQAIITHPYVADIYDFQNSRELNDLIRTGIHGRYRYDAVILAFCYSLVRFEAVTRSYGPTYAAPSQMPHSTTSITAVTSSQPLPWSGTGQWLTSTLPSPQQQTVPAASIVPPPPSAPQQFGTGYWMTLPSPQSHQPGSGTVASSHPQHQPYAAVPTTCVTPQPSGRPMPLSPFLAAHYAAQALRPPAR